MSILVTGGAGFIGANFVLDWLESSDETVVNLDLLTYAGNGENLASLEGDSRHIFVQGDIGDSALVSKLLSEHQIQAVVNFAAQSHVDRSIHSADEFIRTNVMGTFQLLTVARDYWSGLGEREKDTFRFLHVSTDEVYGTLELGEAPFEESCQYRPNNPYSASKASSDHFVRAFHHTYGFPVLTTNCSNNYGPFQFPEKLIPLIVHNALCEKSLPLYGDGLQVRDWLYVRDHCQAIRRVLQSGRLGDVYHIGGKCEQNNLALVQEICTILDKECPRENGSSYKSLIAFVADRPGHDRRYAMNTSKIERELGWKPVETLKTGLCKTVQWYLTNRSWMDNMVSGDYRKWVEKHYCQEGRL